MRSPRCPARTPWTSTRPSTRPTMRSWSSPATSRVDEVKALAETDVSASSSRARPSSRGSGVREPPGRHAVARRAEGSARRQDRSLQRHYMAAELRHRPRPARPRRSTLLMKVVGVGADQPPLQRARGGEAHRLQRRRLLRRLRARHQQDRRLCGSRRWRRSRQARSRNGRRAGRGQGQRRHRGRARRAKSNYIAEYVYDSDSQSTLARRYGWGLVVGRTIEDVDAWPDRISKVTPRRGSKRSPQAYLDIRRSVTGHLLPVPPKAHPQLPDASHGPTAPEPLLGVQPFQTNRQ